MNPILWSALGLGLVGSLHCIGMCGPIALALPATKQSRALLLLHRLAYHVGRVMTYMLLGVIVGSFGQIIAFAGFQQGLSLIAGLIILITLSLSLWVPSALHRLQPNSWLLSLTNRIRDFWSRLFRSPKFLSLFGIGLLNGFLPCGLLYVALAAAAATGNWIDGSLSMFYFGLGTIPALLAVSYLGAFLPAKLRMSASKLIPVGALVMGILLILRGLSLGIPYLSPNLAQRAAENPRTVKECYK